MVVASALVVGSGCSGAVYENRRKAVHSLFVSLRLEHDDSDYFERLVALRKGIKLVARLLPLLKHVRVLPRPSGCFGVIVSL